MGCGKSTPISSVVPTGDDDKGHTATSSATTTDHTHNGKDDKNIAKFENKDFEQTMTFLMRVPLFKRLPKDQHPLLAAACVHVDFTAGAVIIKEGDAGNKFFVIKAGEASVVVEGKGKVATLKSGDYFGENALLRDEPRTATISADVPLETFSISREKFKELGLNNKLQFANRKAVAAHTGVTTCVTKPPSPKTEEERALMTEALRNNENLQTMVSLDDTRVAQMIDVAWKENVAKGQELIKEGDLNADYFYVVQEGSFDIFVHEEAEEGTSAEKAAEHSHSKLVMQVAQGGSFGELALLYLVPRAATVTASSDSIVWVIDRPSFKKILMQVSEEKVLEYVKHLERVEILSSLMSEEKKAVAKALTEMHFTQGEAILAQGDPGSTFYILYDGEVTVYKDGEEQVKLSASISRGTAQFFGERALLSSEPRAATVTVTSSTVKALALDRESFNLLLGPLEDIMKRRASQTAGNSLQKSVMPNGQVARTGDKIMRKDLVKIGLLGCGGFGTVELWEHKKTGETYAMKALSKGYVVKTGMQDSVMNERNILMMTNSLFIIMLYECYNGAQSLYFLMEPALGGELYATYNRKGFHGSEQHAKFYIAGTSYAFEHCHERRIIYRDLKPENLLLNDSGQLKLTDMGLAKFVIGKTFTTCGTPDYFAPELIASTGHTVAVDWWMLGILTFELMVGHPPFESSSPMQICAKVMKGIGKVHFPPKCQGSVRELIKGLLKKEPSERLPMRPGGAKNMRSHKWYSGFDWEKMKEHKVDAPYKPNVKSKKDIANFNARREDMPKHIEYKDDGSGWDKEFAT